MNAAARDDLACKEIVELVTEYLEGALSAEDALDFERHLVYCGWCRDYLAQMRATIELTGTLEYEEPSSPLREQLIAAFRDWRGGSG
jgi:predicted anti-sigma-YlaC factor YlaD